MNQFGFALAGLTVVLALLVALLLFAALRLAAGARKAQRPARGNGTEAALLSAALQEAVGKLRAQEQAMSARAAASEQLSGLIADSLTAGLLLVNSDGRVEILNPAGRRILEPPVEPVGAHYRDLLTRAAPLGEVIAECLASGRPLVRRTIQVPGSIRDSHFGVTVSPLGGAETRRGVICLFSDLTNVVDLEEQLRLKETLAKLGELTAGIAHEFRNGLATIHGYSRLIVPQDLPDRYRPYVEGIRQETEALGAVVTNFLRFAKPEQLSFASVELGIVARRAMDDLRNDLPASTEVRVEGAFCDIQGDDVLLRQVFGNLARNAAEACEVSGVAPVIVIRGDVDAAQGSCRVCVEDNGPGVPESDRERIFQPFFTTRSRGTGLGLAIVQKIVVMHNGRVSVQPSPSGGSSVQLVFPITPQLANS